MSKLAPSLKALINAPSARPGPTPAAKGIADVYARIAREAEGRNLGFRPWVAMSAAATLTLNSPSSLTHLHALASSSPSAASPVQAAELIREVGLKCISFNGIPRTINSLNAFRDALPPSVQSGLETRPSRQPTAQNLDARLRGGRALWDSVYAPHERKLFDKLALAHPDLPVYILAGHYALLLSDPVGDVGEEGGAGRGGLAGLGRVLTSLVAISCLRSQTGVGPQVLSHVYGLRKGVEDGTYEGDVGRDEAAWLASDEGGEWVLNSVDRIRSCLGEEGFTSKL